MGDRSPFPAGYLIVELFYSGAWVDISADVTADGVSITRGQPNEGPTTAAPSTMTVTLLNPAGKYSPRNPRSPLYGLIGRGTPIRVSVKPQSLAPSIRYVGRVYEWPVSWGLTGSPSVTCTVICSGVLRQLAQSAAPDMSPARRTLSVQPGLLAYWPLEDVASARFDAVQGTDVPVGPGIELAAVQPWPGSKALPTFTTGKFTGNCPAYTGTGQIQFRWVGRFTTTMALGPLIIFGFKGGSISRIDIDHTTATTWLMKFYDLEGQQIISAVILPGPDGINAQYALECSQVGLDVTIKWVYINPSNPSGTVYQINMSNETLGIASYIKINPYQTNWQNNEIGHVSISNTISSIFNIRNQIDGYPGELATIRAQRVIAEENINLTTFNGIGSSPPMGIQPTAPTVDVLAEVLAAGHGMLYESRATGGLTYRAAAATYNQSPKLQIGYTDNLIRPLDPVDDDQKTTNTVTVTRSAGGSITVTQADGPLGISTVGDYETQDDVNVSSEAQLLDQANWRLARGTYDEPRWPRLGLDLAHPTFLASTTLTTAALAVDIGDRIRVTSPPPWLPPDVINQRVIGYTETITPWNHRIEYNTDPYQLLIVGRYDDNPSRYSGEGTTLAAAVTDTATTLTITPPPGVTWTSADGNYTILCGGEKMTVTNVTGNTMTVVRGIEGYASAHPAGRPLDLIYALVRYSI